MQNKNFIIAILLALVFPYSACAAGIEVQPSEAASSINDSSSVRVSIDATSALVGALEGSLIIPPEFEVVGISTASSLVSFWVLEPDLSENKIPFAAMFPGGYQGEGLLFTITVRAVKEGRARFALGPGTEIYAPDGVPSRVQMNHKLHSVDIGPAKDTPSVVNVDVDITPPDEFYPDFVRSEESGLDANMLIFEANDRGSGNVTYSLHRAWWPWPLQFGVWRSIQSPYKTSWLDEHAVLFIKAKDGAGNEHIERIIPWWPLELAIIYWYIALPVILFIIAIIIMFAVRVRQRMVARV